MDGWITYGPRCVRPFESAALYSEARQRVLASPRLSKYMDILLAEGWADEDHLRWVICGKVSEIVAWAEQIRRDSAQDS
jgi:hypothetical protein